LIPTRTIGMIAAMKEEIEPLLRLAGPCRQEVIEGFRLYHFTAGTRPVCLIRSGMGPAHAATATRILLDAVHPELVISFGFAGGLTPELKTGDLIVANRLLFLHDRLFSEQQGLAVETARECSEMLATQASRRVHLGALITTARITGKGELAKRLPAGITTAAVEMETAAVARMAVKDKVPVLAIRAISDGLDDELGFSLEDFCDRELNLKLWRVLLTVVRKPWIIPQLLRLAKNTEKAGMTLAEAVQGFLKGKGADYCLGLPPAEE